MIVLVSLIVLLRRLLVYTIFRMVHPCITVHSIFTLVYITVALVAREGMVHDSRSAADTEV